MQLHKVTRIKCKNECNAASARTRFSEAKVETKDKKKFTSQGPNFRRQAPSRRRLNEAGTELDFATFLLRRHCIFENLKLDWSWSTVYHLLLYKLVFLHNFLPFSVNLFRFEVYWSEVLTKSLGVGLEPKLLMKKLGWSRNRNFATLLLS